MNLATARQPAVNLRRILDRRPPGSGEPLTPELQAIVERALPAARAVAGKYLRAYGPDLDWHEEVSLRLCERVGDYDPSKSTPGTWGASQAHYACRESIRRSVPRKGRGKIRHRIGITIRSLDRTIVGNSDWAGRGTSLAALVPDRRPTQPTAADIEAGRRMLKGLTAIERAVAWAVFVEGRTHAELADTFGLSDTRVCQIKAAALGRLRETHLQPRRKGGGK